MTFISTDILNPYNRKIISTDSYATLIAFLLDKYPNGFERATDISINGKILEVDDYDALLSDKDIIVLLDRAALPVGLIGGWFITALANLAISIAISYIANKLFAPDELGEQAAPSTVYNVTSGQNTARYGAPIPIVYGTVRMYPSMIVQPYYRFENNIEYLYHVLCVGQGRHSVPQIMIGDDVITSTDGLQWKLLNKEHFYDIPTNAYGIHLTKTLASPQNLQLKGFFEPSERYTINNNASSVEFDLYYPGGVFKTNDEGEYKSLSTTMSWTLSTLLGGVYTIVNSGVIVTTGSNADPIQKTINIDISGYNENVYIHFIGEIFSNTKWHNEAYIKRVKEIYPNEDFTSRYGDITLLVCKIKATNSISTAGQVKVNGYFTRTDVGNSMEEVLTDIYTNATYGGALSGDSLYFPVTNANVDCCYEENITIFDAMRKPALAQGFSLFLAGMDVILKKDAPNTVTSGMYNEMNILRNSLKVQYIFKEEFPSYDGFECTYIDGDGWKPKIALYPPTSTRPQSVDLFGVVDWHPPYDPYQFYMVVTSSVDPVMTSPENYTITNNMNGTYTVTNSSVGSVGLVRMGNTSSNSSITKVEIYKTDTVTEMEYMFYSTIYPFSNLEYVNFKYTCDMSNAVDVGGIFRECTKLKGVQFNWVNYQSISQMYQMFYECSALICINKLDTRYATDKSSMFSGNTALVAPDGGERTLLMSTSGYDYVNPSPCP